ncbi:MAG: ammonium transporter [Pseudobdellovibrionaceae bacterium]
MDAQTTVNTGDTAWMLISTALVLLMTPGLAFFYAGMVRAKNVVSTLFQSVSAVAVVGLLWAVAGYSLVFSGDKGGLIGNLDLAFLQGVGLDPHPTYGPTIPHVLFMAFQMMFAVITPALITGAFAERINFKAWIPFMALWVLAVYIPIAHWVWGPNGWIAQLGGLDFAGGLVVHMSAGFSALAASLYLGRRADHRVVPMKSYNIALVVLGTALLTFGWFGFNAGSALGANGLAAQALATTFFGCAAASFAWMMMDWVLDKPTLVGSSVGAVAGLVAITPAAGYVTLPAALLIGLCAGLVCNGAVRAVKKYLHVMDDTLDVFACHGVGGLLGTILTGVFASKAVNPAAANGLYYGESKVFVANLIAAGVVALFSVAASFLLFRIVEVMVPVRVPRELEEKGLDTLHGEEILALDEVYISENRLSVHSTPKLQSAEMSH